MDAAEAAPMGLETLDTDSLRHVLQRLDGVSLARVAGVSTTLRAAANFDDTLWAELVHRFFWVCA